LGGFALFFFLLLDLSSLKAFQNDQKEKEIAIPLEAFVASRDALKTGHGIANYQFLEKAAGANDFSRVVEADVEVFFDEEKYHIRLEFLQHPEQLTRRIIIYDGSAIFGSRFSDRISRTGAETRVEPKNDISHLVKPTLFDFRWDVTGLNLTFLDAPGLLKKQRELGRVVESNSASEDSYGWTVHVDQITRAVYEFTKLAGYNPTSRKVFEDGVLVNETTGKWNRSNNTWYISSLSDWEGFRGRSQKKWILSYSSFEANIPIDPKLFTIPALEMPAGTRIVDSRPNDTKKARFHYVPHSDAEIEAGLSSMVEQLETLPATNINPLTTEKHSSSECGLCSPM
jgi:hypothetical protein